MADYIYTMESRLSPEQLRTVGTVQNIARSHGMNVYLTGGAIRDILTGFPIRDLDFTVQGNPLELQKDMEAAGGIVDMVDSAFNVIHAVLRGIQVEIGMARAEVFDKPGKPPLVTPATINEDLRRRDFTFNAMALSLNDGSRGLLLDPFNGAADIEARLIRILHSYAFLEDPSRLIRATRFASRFGWELEERTRARYDSAREGEYIQYINPRAIGYEIEQIAYEDNPITVMKALEEQGWLKVLLSKWTVAKADLPEVAHLLKTRATMAEFNIGVDAAPAVMHFLTLKLGEAEVTVLQKLLPHREFVASWKRLENDAKELSKKLLAKEAAINSVAWKILSTAKPEALLYLDVTGRNKTVDEKLKNFFGKWRQVQEKIPYAQMVELRITPQLPEYSRICQEAFLLLLDGKLRTEAEIAKFLAPFEPPPPPPPPTPVRRGRSAAKKQAPPAVTAPAAAAAIAVASKAAAATSPAPEVSASAVKAAKPEHPGEVPARKSAVAAKPVVKSTVKAVVKTHAAKPTPKKAAKSAKAVPVSKVSPHAKSVARGVKPNGKSALKKPAGKKPAATLIDKKKHGHNEPKKQLKLAKRR